MCPIGSGKAIVLSKAHLMGRAFVAVPSLRALLLSPAPVVRAHITAPAPPWQAYAVNLRTVREGGGNEVTQYQHFPFSQVLWAHGRYFGITPGGLFALGGTDDAGVPLQWALQVAITDFAEARQKRVAAGYVAGRLPPTAVFEVSAGEGAAAVYRYPNLRGTRGQNYRCEFGRGLLARYYAFALSGSGGAEIHSIDIDVAPQGRRV